MINYGCAPVNCLDLGRVNSVKIRFNISTIKGAEKPVHRPLLVACEVVSWYDNENSYTSQMVRTIKYFAEL